MFKKTVSFREEYERSKMITSGKIRQFFYSTQTVSTSQTSELLHFLKNCVAKSISLLYTFGEFLAKSLKITHLNLLLITQKAFQSAYITVTWVFAHSFQDKKL